MFELVYDRKEYSDSFPEWSEFCNTVCWGWEGVERNWNDVRASASARARAIRRSGEERMKTPRFVFPLVIRAAQPRLLQQELGTGF